MRSWTKALQSSCNSSSSKLSPHSRNSLPSRSHCLQDSQLACRLQKALAVAIRSSSNSCRLSTTDGGNPWSWLQRTSNRWARRSQTHPREASGNSAEHESLPGLGVMWSIIVGKAKDRIPILCLALGIHTIATSECY